MTVSNVISRQIAAAKRRFKAGGLLQRVEWGVPTGERDERGRRTYEYSDLDVFIEDRPALDRWDNSSTRPGR